MTGLSGVLASVALIALIMCGSSMNTLLLSCVVGVGMLLIERVIPGTKMPKVAGWLWRAVMLNLCQIAIVIVAGVTWNEWLKGWSLLHATTWPDWIASLTTYIFSTFVFYWWHRIRHESHFWWRFAHQIHHSASRLEILTSFYKHPFEILINSVLSALLVYPIMGCSAQQGAYYTLLIAVGEMFYHWNVHTPRWLGHWFQRPESHRIHHQRDRHSKNYSDLPIWDKLFGTFSNPTNGDKVMCGFSDVRERKLTPMLLAREVETARVSEPLVFRPCCFGCEKSHRCDR
jgi:sterol desaturase/sphingolipid hydroxylase (fatty acid hydroxylase superfamily)